MLRRFFNGARPTVCANCKEPFLSINGRVDAESENGHYFCSTWCRDNYAEPRPLALVVRPS